jgi:anti-sigma factor RsiW
MTCAEIEELLSDLIDNEIAEDARDGAESHLASCEACAATYKKMLRTVRFVRTNARVDIVPGSTGALYAAFSRSHVDPSLAASARDVIREAGFADEEGDPE